MQLYTHLTSTLATGLEILRDEIAESNKQQHRATGQWWCTKVSLLTPAAANSIWVTHRQGSSPPFIHRISTYHLHVHLVALAINPSQWAKGRADQWIYTKFCNCVATLAYHITSHSVKSATSDLWPFSPPIFLLCFNTTFATNSN
jgi:hypothetical protein